MEFSKTCIYTVNQKSKKYNLNEKIYGNIWFIFGNKFL